MTPIQKADRRRHRRYPLARTIDFHHGPTQREFPARCVDISESGMLMYVPVTTPVKPGQSIRLTVAGPAPPEVASLEDRPLEATIVRVERHGLLITGKLVVGVEFASAPMCSKEQ
jgi:c-di-GMP-binding flagellar brake protein YcgR